MGKGNALMRTFNYECKSCGELYHERTETGYCIICEGSLVEVNSLDYDEEYDNDKDWNGRYI
jgi:rRNA maturation endonuclease Nob1